MKLWSVDVVFTLDEFVGRETYAVKGVSPLAVASEAWSMWLRDVAGACIFDTWHSGSDEEPWRWKEICCREVDTGRVWRTSQ